MALPMLRLWSSFLSRNESRQRGKEMWRVTTVAYFPGLRSHKEREAFPWAWAIQRLSWYGEMMVLTSSEEAGELG